MSNEEINKKIMGKVLDLVTARAIHTIFNNPSELSNIHKIFKHDDELIKQLAEEIKHTPKSHTLESPKIISIIENIDNEIQKLSFELKFTPELLKKLEQELLNQENYTTPKQNNESTNESQPAKPEKKKIPIKEKFIEQEIQEKITALSTMFNGHAIEALARVKTIGQVDPLSPKEIKVNGVNIFSPTSAKKIGVGAAKIFRYALAAFTKINPKNTPSNKINLRVFLDLNDYAQANGVDISSDTKRWNFTRKIRNALEELRQSGATWTEKIKGKDTPYAGVNYIGYYEVGNNTIMVEFTLKMAEYLVLLPILDYPRALYSLKDDDYNAFAIGEALAIHYGIDNNVLRGTEDKLKIETILKYTSFPTYEELKAHKWSWRNLVKEPLENCLDRLYQAGFIKKWEYAHTGGIPLTDDEARNINNYGEFVSLILLYELNEYKDTATRAKAIAEKRAEKMKKLTQAKKRKKSDNN